MTAQYNRPNHPSNSPNQDHRKTTQIPDVFLNNAPLSIHSSPPVSDNQHNLLHTTPVQGRRDPSDENTPSSLSPFTIDDSGSILYDGEGTLPTPPHRWIRRDLYHARHLTYTDNGASTSVEDHPSDAETDYPLDEDSEDDFKWKLFAPGRFSRRFKRDRHSFKSPRSEAPEGEQTFNDTALSKSKWKTTLELERLKLERMYYVAMIKLNMRLSILSKVIELVSVSAMGFKWSIKNWLSLGVQLALNTITSSCILWRFSGKYCLHEETVLPALKARLFDRERRCVFWQSFFKFFASVSLLVFSLIAILNPITITDGEAFFRSTFLTAGFSTGGFISRMTLTGWVTYMSWKGFGGKSRSISAENIFSWITSFFSLETAAISYYLIYNSDDMTRVTKALGVGDYIQLGLAVVAFLFGFKDLWVAIYKLKSTDKSPQDEQAPLTYNESIEVIE